MQYLALALKCHVECHSTAGYFDTVNFWKVIAGSWISRLQLAGVNSSIITASHGCGTEHSMWLGSFLLLVDIEETSLTLLDAK